MGFRREYSLGYRLVILAVLLLGVLQASAPVASAAAPSELPARYGRTDPPSLVRLTTLPAVGSHPNLAKPFLPRDNQAYASAKGLTPSAPSGRRKGVTTAGGMNRQGAAAQQELAGFPTMSMTQQVSLYGSGQATTPPILS
jgi:hypothetical protein